MAEIEVYYSSVCGLCSKTLEYFRSQNLTFTARAVEWDGTADRFVDSENARSMYERCGDEVDFVPQIFIGDRHIRGWRKLEPMIASGEFAEVLNG